MRVMTRVSIIGAGALTALLAVVTPAQASAPVVLSVGHVDVFGVAFEDGALNLHVHADEPEAEYAPHEVRLDALPGSKTTVPNDPRYAFLGAPGAPVWILPEVQNEELLFPGFGAEELEPGVFVGDSVRVRLIGAHGPGDFSVFTTDAAGTPNIIFDTGNGLPDTFTLGVGGHLHANFAFEGAGDYYLLVVVTARLASNGNTVASNLGLYHFKVHA